MRSRLTRTFTVFAALSILAAACGGGGTGGGATGTPSGTGAAAVQPTRPAEFVISTAPGGGSDIYARLWISIIEENKLSPVSILPVNREGGAGAVAFTHVFEKRGDMHYIMVTLNSFWTTVITNKQLPYKTTDFTPIANLANDPFFLWVAEDSAIKTAQDFVKAATERSITVAGTGSKQEDEVLFRRIQDLAKTKAFTYVPQTSGGAVATALAGKQGGVEVTVNNPSEGLGLFQGSPRRIRPVCAFTPNPPTEGAFKDLATCKSQGLAIDDYYNIRSVVAPPGLSAAQQQFWVDVFTKLSETPKWKSEMTRLAITPNFLAGDSFKKLITDFETLHRDIATKNGWI
jgi:putative tricarboxylic transport membrane protein